MKEFQAFIARGDVLDLTVAVFEREKAKAADLAKAEPTDIAPLREISDELRARPSA